MKKIVFTVLCLLVFPAALRAESTGEILTFPANPEKGFHWGYALYLPKTMDTSKKLPMVLMMTDVGITNSAEETEKDTLYRLRHELSEYPVADELGVPLIMPMVQRPRVGFYTHALSRAVFVSQDEKFKRLDLQVLDMIKDARRELKERHIKTQEKVLVTGFSAAGVFAWRWTMLHPEYVLATVTGGALYHMLPVEELNGERLIYPVGVGDLQEITGKKFNKKAWSKIPILSTNGEKDNNDTFVYSECFDPKTERPVLAKVLPGKDVLERRAQSIQLLNEMAPNVQTHLYPWLGHKPVTGDVIAFLKKHINGGPLRPIELRDTSDQKPNFPVRIVHIMWGNDPQVPAEYKAWIDPHDLVLQTNVTHPSWVYNQYGEIDILHRGKVVGHPVSHGSISDGKKSLLFFGLSAEELARLRKEKGRTFSVRAKYPDYLNIPADLTFTVK